MPNQLLTHGRDVLKLLNLFIRQVVLDEAAPTKLNQANTLGTIDSIDLLRLVPTRATGITGTHGHRTGTRARAPSTGHTGTRAPGHHGHGLQNHNGAQGTTTNIANGICPYFFNI